MEMTFPITGPLSELLKFKATKQVTSREEGKQSFTISMGTGAFLSLGFVYQPV